METVTNAPQAKPVSSARRPLSVRKKLMYCAIVLLGLPLLLVAVLEVGGHLYIHWRYGVPGKSYGIYQYDAELGATHRPNSYNTNAQLNDWGFRNTENVFEPKPMPSWRIYCSGGSTTFCYNLADEETWPAQLQGLLRQRPGHQRDQVLNGGQIAQALSHEFILAKRFVPKLRPDVVLIHTGINEHINGALLRESGESLEELQEQQRFGVAARNLGQAGFLMRNSVLVRLAQYKMRGWFGAEPPAEVGPPHPYLVENFQVVLGRYLDFLAAQGSRPIILRFGDSGDPANPMLEVHRIFRELAVKIARDRKVEVCDLAARFDNHPRRRELFIASGVHVTAEGAGLMAKEILATLLNPPAR